VNLELVNAAIGYGRRALISCLDLKVNSGDVIFLSGPNGSGKSTLAKTLIGVMPLLGGRRVTSFRRMAYVPQSSHFDVQYPLTVQALVAQGVREHLAIRELFRSSAGRVATQKVLEQVGLVSCAKSLLREVSGGQLQRALIARALVANPDFLLLDEPFSNLDRSGRGEVAAILREFAGGNRTVCVIDHGDAIEKSFYTRFLEIETGHLLEQGRS
jgi:ABC-type Mn2+/Zn2+ transport system ATPase subunit